MRAASSRSWRSSEHIYSIIIFKFLTREFPRFLSQNNNLGIVRLRPEHWQRRLWRVRLIIFSIYYMSLWAMLYFITLTIMFSLLAANEDKLKSLASVELQGQEAKARALAELEKKWVSYFIILKIISYLCHHYVFWFTYNNNIYYGLFLYIILVRSPN